VLQKVQNAGVDPDATGLSLKALGVQVAPLIEEDCAVIAKWWFADSALALGDRCCLALAERVGGQAVTAEQRWGDLRDIDVLLIR
jgi:PIN domain nuclease of toxin-antitoxin system